MADNILEQISASRSILGALNGRASLSKVSKSEKERIIASLQSCAIATTSLGRIAEAIQKAGFLDEDQGVLLDAVAEKATTSGPPQKMMRTNTQDFVQFVHHMPASLWQRLQEGHVYEFLDGLLRLGLRNPTEPTSQAIALVVLHQTEGYEKALSTTPEARLEFARSIKSMFKGRAKIATRPVSHIEELPATPKELQRKYPLIYDSAFATETPSPCPIPELEIGQLKATSRMRCLRLGTSSSIASSSSSALCPMTASLNPMQNPMQYGFMQFGQSMMMQMQQLTESVAQMKSGGGHAGHIKILKPLAESAAPCAPLLQMAVGGGHAQQASAGQCAITYAQQPPSPSPSPTLTPIKGFQEQAPSPLVALPVPQDVAPQQLETILEPPKPKVVVRQSVDAATKAIMDRIAAEPTTKGKSKGKAKAKAAKAEAAKGKATAKAEAAKGKAKAKAEAKAEVKSVVGPKSIAKALAKYPMPKLGKHPPFHIGTCTIYADSTRCQWRTIEATNRRRDIKFSWKSGGDESKDRIKTHTHTIF